MKDNILDIYVKKFCYSDSIETCDLSFIPPLVKRRLSKLDRMSIYGLENSYTDDIENIVFSSFYGEYEKLVKIIEQYKIDKEVSPNNFSGSVHNFPVGFFLLNKKNPIPYNAISSDENNISYGLLTSLISNFSNILYCYSDIKDDKFVTFCLNFTKKHTNDLSKYRIEFTNNKIQEPSINEFVDIFNGNRNILTAPLFTVGKITND